MQTKEVKVPGLPQVYRLVEVEENGKDRATGRFRVRKRIKVGGKWTTRLQTFDRYDDARAFAKIRFVQSDVKGRSDLFEDVLSRFLLHKKLREQLAEGSLDGYRNRSRHLRFFEGLTMSQISPKAVDAWLDLLLDPAYRASQHKTRVSYEHEYFLLSGVFTYYRNCEEEGFKTPLLNRHREIACKRDRDKPMVDLRYLSAEEEISFLSALSSELIRDFALFQLHTGTRVGEAAALEFRNLNFHRDEIQITQHLHWERKKGAKTGVLPGTKGGPSRRIPLTDICKEMLKLRQRNGSSIVFGAANGSWLSYRAIQNAYDRAFKKLGLPHRGTHSLRHTFAVRFLEQTKDINALQALLGHADLKETLRYAKYTNESVRSSFKLFRGGQALGGEDVPQLVPRH